MPVLTSTFEPLFWAKSGFVSTVYSGLIRRVNELNQTRERLELDDGDFMDLDWSYANKPTKSVIILLHGLEGDAQRPYITGSAKYFNENGIDACAVNFRGCSGEPNRLFRSYHSGATDDLSAVVNHIVNKSKYQEIYIKGISLGANMALKYVGEERVIPRHVKAVIAVSAPCDLLGACKSIMSLKNKPYSVRFLRHLKKKLEPKLNQFPQNISKRDYHSIKSIMDFDDVYTSRAHGFKDAKDYYAKCSSLQFLSAIKVPSLILNAKNDSFLSRDCYPIKQANQNPNLFLEMPRFGGHVGFIADQNIYYNERRALHFVRELGS